jgi:hypothetical protein
MICTQTSEDPCLKTTLKGSLRKYIVHTVLGEVPRGVPFIYKLQMGLLGLSM